MYTFVYYQPQASLFFDELSPGVPVDLYIFRNDYMYNYMLTENEFRRKVNG